MVPIGSIFASKARKGLFKMFGFVKPDILLLLKTYMYGKIKLFV